jgi:hypothetical protein
MSPLQAGRPASAQAKELVRQQDREPSMAAKTGPRSNFRPLPDSGVSLRLLRNRPRFAPQSKEILGPACETIP